MTLMNEDIAKNIVFDKLLGENSIPVRLRTKSSFSMDEVEILYNALDFLIDFYHEKTDIPKKLALAFVDVYGAFSFREWMYDEKMLNELEDIGIELQDKATQLLS
ncbi:hypothetical protein Xsto_03862 [Xenorhabdus stockiae]|uniref:Uncharacterized protein n=1 Tax=Xenorhabdus stockiae TaxID=351614 RepID=A0A2D0KB27_9GAMM|nr:hypothetical protein [Xenorhabdus stockiae]PHM60572.1 hypothetical protein Xsto_03862 [Xenorhabdus stockiae]